MPQSIAERFDIYRNGLTGNDWQKCIRNAPTRCARNILRNVTDQTLLLDNHRLRRSAAGGLSCGVTSPATLRPNMDCASAVQGSPTPIRFNSGGEARATDFDADPE